LFTVTKSESLHSSLPMAQKTRLAPRTYSNSAYAEKPQEGPRQPLPRAWVLVLGVLLSALGGVAHGQQATAPITRHPNNPHYFLWRGQPTALVGASYLSYRAWTTEDYVYMLDVSHAYGLNVFRIWNTVSKWPDTNGMHPWARSSTPGAADGGNKYDLDMWNPAYFARLKDLVAHASDRGIVVEVTLLNGYSSVWAYSPLNAANNIQGMGVGKWRTFLTLGDTALQARQQAVITKVVQELNSFDNVYFEIMNEPDPVFDVPWHNQMIQTVVNAEADLPNKHLIAIDGPEYYDHLNPKPAIINTHYAHGRGWMGTFSMLDQMYDRNRMLGADEMSEVPHEMTPTDGRVEAWEFMVGGGSVYNGLINGNRRSASWDKVEAHAYRRYLRYLKTFLASFDFVRMRQDKRVIHGGLPAGAFARVISELGKQYALYLHHSARMDTHYIVRPGTYQARLLLALPAGSYHAAWVLPESGAVVKMESFRHAGGNRMLSSPRYTIDIALWIQGTTHS
jgi:Cellulase (glycosyl hydrolase family 5)